MCPCPFQQQRPRIADNPRLRTPQREAYIELASLKARTGKSVREVGVVMPVGCGKSGCITITPFAMESRRTLVVSPNVRIAEQLLNDFDPAHPKFFYRNCNVLSSDPYPEVADIRGTSTNIGDLNDAHVVVTNIQQLQGELNRWIDRLSKDFFDLILFDEGHHNTAQSWRSIVEKFEDARIVSFSATPIRSDGERMAGEIIYSYPVFRAIQEGYVKRMKAVVLNPKTLRYVRKEDGKEVAVSLDEVCKLGEQDADFRRSIVTSKVTLDTIVDASLARLKSLRTNTGEKRLKIIASALNYRHCMEIVAAYEERNFRADFVHSLQDSVANQRVLRRLENDELDVIVQVRKLGEGFDHPFLAVAAVFSIFSNLSPFVQFVGRIMRVIKQDSPDSSMNCGIVVFHAGGNVAQRWKDFQEFSEADREYFDQLLPLEGYTFDENDEFEIEPEKRSHGSCVVNDGVSIAKQSEVNLQEIPLIEKDPEACKALGVLKEKGYSGEQVLQGLEKLEPIPVTRIRRRRAMRKKLDNMIRVEAGGVLGQRGLSHEGHDLDRRRLGQSNFVIVKAAIDRAVNSSVGHTSRERHEFTREELDRIESQFPDIVQRAVREVFDATN